MIDLNFSELNFLRQNIRQEINKNNNEADIKRILPYLDRILRNYLLLLEEKGEKEIDDKMAKKLGIAAILYAAGYAPENAEIFLEKHKFEDFREQDSRDIIFAIRYCGEMRKKWFVKFKQVAYSKNVLASLLAFLVHMDELGTRNYSLYRTIQNYGQAKDHLDIFGKMLSKNLASDLKVKRIGDSLGEMLENDDSVVATAILNVLRTRHFIAPIKGFLNEKIIDEIEKRKGVLRMELEKIIIQKAEDEESLVS
jgi:hypothetical protein